MQANLIKTCVFWLSTATFWYQSTLFCCDGHGHLLIDTIGTNLKSLWRHRIGQRDEQGHGMSKQIWKDADLMSFDIDFVEMENASDGTNLWDQNGPKVVTLIFEMVSFNQHKKLKNNFHTKDMRPTFRTKMIKIIHNLLIANTKRVKY